MRDQSLLFRGLATCVALAAMLFVLRADRAPFPHRMGDVAPHGHAASVDFRRLNETLTDRERAVRADEVPVVFDNDPEPLGAVLPMLERDLRRLVTAESLAGLADETRDAFGLDPSDPRFGDGVDSADRPDPAAEFNSLRSLVSGDGGAADSGDVRRSPELILKAVAPVLSALAAAGTTTSEALNKAGVRAGDPVAVRGPDGGWPGIEGGSALVSQADVVLADLLPAEGRVGSVVVADQVLEPLAPWLRRWLRRRVPVTLTYNEAATEAAREAARAAVEPKYDQYEPGDLLIEPGRRVDAAALAILRAEHEAVRESQPVWFGPVRVVCVAALVVLAALPSAYFLARFEPGVIRRAGALSVFLGAVVLTTFLARELSFDPWRAEIIPIAAMAMVFAVTYNQLVAGLAACVVSAAVAATTTAGLDQFLLLSAASVAAVVQLGSVSSRSKLIKVGFVTAGCYAVFAVAIRGCVDGAAGDAVFSTDGLVSAVKGAAWCLGAAYLVSGSLPFIESLFGVVTDISLLEMGDVSHPLLQELITRAPGTYNHSVAVATIGETAADRIGANGLLVRASAYFHDVGKMLKPQYFIENMSDADRGRHDQLNPAMSTLIIIGHVKDGVDLAREHNLPKPMIDFIEQHHGTTLVEYFYRQATEQAENSPDEGEVEESGFRYPGPKPQTRESAVMMLADAVESASRTLREPTASRIENLVESITMRRLLDGQFDECPLTLREIREVESSLTKSLIGIYHGRIQYPDAKGGDRDEKKSA